MHYHKTILIITLCNVFTPTCKCAKL